MTDNNLFAEPEKDGFKHESPIRAFTEFNLDGSFAIGKGFRPSLQHLPTYLDAMLQKEGWDLVQILEATKGKPSFVFRRQARLSLTGVAAAMKPTTDEKRPVAMSPILGAPYGVTDLEKVFYQHRAWTPAGAWDRLRTLMEEGILRPGTATATKAFLRAETGLSVDHYWRTASVASVLRFVKFAGLEHEIKLASPEVTSDLGAPHDQRIHILIAGTSMRHVEAIGSFKAGKWWISIDGVGTSLKELKGEPRAWRKSLAVEWTYPPIPPMVYWSPEGANFYGITSNRGQGVDFYNKWQHRYKEFPQSRHEDDSPLASVPEFEPEEAKHEDLAQDRVGFVRPGDVRMKHIRPVPNSVTVSHDDPVNPVHYAGRECADIGERLSANGYQILKYCWRLGKKDDPCVELGKAIWYGESEAELLDVFESLGFEFRPTVAGIKGDLDEWFESRIAGQSQFTQNIARMLWAGYDIRRLRAIIEAISEEQFHRDCGRGLAV